MSVLAIILVVLAVLVLGLFTIGLVGAMRRSRATEEGLQARLEHANEALADARALDRGWDLGALQTAARAAVDRRDSDAKVRGVHLVQVIDNPGTDDDEARFHVDVAMGRDFEVRLGRRGGEWAEISEAG
jgi:hypothetical protein